MIVVSVCRTNEVCPESSTLDAVPVPMEGVQVVRASARNHKRENSSMPMDDQDVGHIEFALDRESAVSDLDSPPGWTCRVPDTPPDVSTLIAELSEELVGIHHLDGALLEASPSLSRAKEYGLVGLAAALTSALHPEDFARVRSQLMAMADGQDDMRMEWRVGSDEAPFRWIECRARLMRDPAGEPWRIVTVSHDATKRKQAESALRKTNRRIANILENVSDAFFVLDRQWRITYANARAEQWLLLPRYPAGKRVFWEICPGEIRDHLYASFDRALHKQSVAEIQNCPLPAGAWADVRAFPSQDGIAVYMQDVSGQRRAEAGLKESVGRLQRSVEGVVGAMAFAVEIRDPFTAGHQRRVSILASAIARHLGYEPDAIETIRMGGLLHDTGKIAIPAEILCRPGKLSAPEISIIRTHAQVGYDVLKGIEFPKEIALVALQHHERLDGSGYPAGLRSDEIIPEARIMAVADVVEAMASHRPYRPALGMEKALAEVIQHRGTRYEDASVEACLAVFTHHGFDFEQLIRAEEKGRFEERVMGE